MKKVLILTVTAGNAHNACANAMKNKLLETEDVQVEIVDLLKQFSSSKNVWTADKGYNIAIGKFPHTYEFFYNHYKKSKPENRYVCAAQGVATSVVEGLYNYIWNYKPDVIYITHFYGAIAITNLRLVAKIPAKVIVTSLDYVNSPFWEAGIGVDYFSIAHSDFLPECIEEGFREDQIIINGLPVDGKFYNSQTKEKACQELGIDKDKFTIMVMFGGGTWAGGKRIFDDLIKCLDFSSQVIMINGKDKKGYDDIQEAIENNKYPSYVKIVNVGFTKNVELYLSAADCLLGKMGGASATEAINSRTPLLVTTKIYGQEMYNLKYLMQKGIAHPFKNKSELSKLIHHFYNNKDELKKASNACDSMRTNAIESLSEFILNQPIAEYNEKDKIDSENLINKVKLALKKEHKKINKKSK